MSDTSEEENIRLDVVDAFYNGLVRNKPRRYKISSAQAI